MELSLLEAKNTSKNSTEELAIVNSRISQIELEMCEAVKKCKRKRDHAAQAGSGACTQSDNSICER